MVWTGSESDKRSLKAWKQKRFKEGFCVTCGKNPHPEGKRVCKECIVKGYNARRPLVAKKIAAGICSNCLGRPARPHRLMCEVCTEKARDINRKDGLKRRCQKRGITEEKYNEILSAQKGRCAICDHEPQKGQKQLAIDHCHAKNIVRGLLCETCNLGIGQFKDNSEILLKAINYLSKF